MTVHCFVTRYVKLPPCFLTGACKVERCSLATNDVEARLRAVKPLLVKSVRRRAGRNLEKEER